MTVLLLLIGYLLGSIPTGLVVGKLLKGVDLRTVGSGNIGTANAFRELGPVGGVLTLLGDLFKGVIPVVLVTQGPLAVCGPFWIALWQVLAGLSAIVGHNNSIFLGFKGGKGIATSLGVVVALNWQAAIACFVVWAVVVGVSRYSSLGSLAGAVALPVAMYLFTPRYSLPEQRALAVYMTFAVLATVLAFYKHRTNIANLRQGTERKLFGKKESVGPLPLDPEIPKPPDQSSGGVDGRPI